MNIILLFISSLLFAGSLYMLSKQLSPHCSDRFDYIQQIRTCFDLSKDKNELTQCLIDYLKKEF